MRTISEEEEKVRKAAKRRFTIVIILLLGVMAAWIIWGLKNGVPL